MKRVSEYFQKQVLERNITGAVCSVSQNGTEIFNGRFGYSDVAQTKPMQGDEYFRLASMTKPITAAAVMLAAERGLLDIDAPIGRYISGFHHGGVGTVRDGETVLLRPAREVTLRDILCHTSGIGHDGFAVSPYLFAKRRKKPSSLKENVDSWNGELLSFAPGEIHTSYGAVVPFEIAARAVECVSETPFDEFLKREIFAPLSMSDTLYRLDGDRKKRMAEVSASEGSDIHSVDYGYAGFHMYEEGYTGGSAGLFSTLSDYCKFADMLLFGRGLLKKASLDEIRRIQYPVENSVSGWGLGVRVLSERRGNQTLPVGSFGWSGYYGTHFWCEPSTGIVAVLMLCKDDCGGAGSRFSLAFEKLLQEDLSEK